MRNSRDQSTAFSLPFEALCERFGHRHVRAEVSGPGRGALVRERVDWNERELGLGEEECV